MYVLLVGVFEIEDCVGDGLVVFGSRVGLVVVDWILCIVEVFFVGVVVLGDEGGYVFGMFDGELEIDRCVIVEYVDCIVVEFECIDEGFGGVGECIE